VLEQAQKRSPMRVGRAVFFGLHETFVAAQWKALWCCAAMRQIVELSIKSGLPLPAPNHTIG
jgi:hypothetical protein